MRKLGDNPVENFLRTKRPSRVGIVLVIIMLTMVGFMVGVEYQAKVCDIAKKQAESFESGKNIVKIEDGINFQGVRSLCAEYSIDNSLEMGTGFLTYNDNARSINLKYPSDLTITDVVTYEQGSVENSFYLLTKGEVEFEEEIEKMHEEYRARGEEMPGWGPPPNKIYSVTTNNPNQYALGGILLLKGLNTGHKTELLISDWADTCKYLTIDGNDAVIFYNRPEMINKDILVVELPGNNEFFTLSVSSDLNASEGLLDLFIANLSFQ
jgi:hypothetical protein